MDRHPPQIILPEALLGLYSSWGRCYTGGVHTEDEDTNMTQNAGRLPIVEDTTRTFGIAKNPFGDCDGQEDTYYVDMYDPAFGCRELVSEPFATWEEADAFRAII